MSTNTEVSVSTNVTIKDPVLEPFFIVKDSYCYTVYENAKSNPKYTSDGTSKDYLKACGHYTDIGNCLRKIAKCKINLKKEYNSIREYIKEYNQILDLINKTLKNLNE